MKQSPGIRMIEGWFVLYGGVVLVASLFMGVFKSDAWMGLLVSGVFFSLFGVTLLIDLKTRRLGLEHWAQAVPERFRASYAVWYFFVSVGPILFSALLAAFVKEDRGLRLAALGAIILLIGAFCAFAAIDRAVVMRRKRRELSGDLPQKKTRLIHIIQAFFVLIGLSGFLLTFIGPSSDKPLMGILIGVGGFVAFLVCWLIERKIQPRKDFKMRWVHGVYGYCIPFGIFLLLLILGAFIAKSIDSAAETNRGSGIEDYPHLLLLVPGFCFALIGITYIIDRLNIRISEQTQKKIKPFLITIPIVIGISFFLYVWCDMQSLLNERTMADIIERLHHEDRISRDCAAQRLGEMGDERAVKPLIELLGDENGEVRLSAVKALGEIGSPDATEALLGKLNDKDSQVRGAAAVALADIGDKSIISNIRQLFEKDIEKDSRVGAAYGLVKMSKDEDAFFFLINSLNDKSWTPRTDAIEALMRIGGTRAVEPLIAMLEDFNNEVRVSAVQALGKMKDRRSVMPLIEVLSDEYWLAQRCAASALGEIGDERAIEPLLDILKNVDGCLRVSAAEALGKMGVTRAVEPIIGMLTSEEWIDKWRAAEALAAIGDKKAVEPLINTLKDTDDTVRCNVAAALGDLGDKRAVAMLKEVWENDKEKTAQIGAAYALYKINRDEEAFSFIVNILSEKRTHACATAARILQKTTDWRAVGPLIDVMKDGGEYCHIFAADALKSITGQDFGGSYARWKAWYDKNKDK